MPASPTTPDAVLGLAIDACRGGEAAMRQALNSLAVPVYATDPSGLVTFANRACADFAGREPKPGEDRWCVSWKLFSLEGEPLPHENCPMAVAIVEKRPIRGAEAMAERPDGSRVRFRPYPTPVFGGDGNLAGAVNLLIDVTVGEQAARLRSQADKCRRLARALMDPAASETLKLMAAEYEEKARALPQLH